MLNSFIDSSRHLKAIQTFPHAHWYSRYSHPHSLMNLNDRFIISLWRSKSHLKTACIPCLTFIVASANNLLNFSLTIFKIVKFVCTEQYLIEGASQTAYCIFDLPPASAILHTESLQLLIFWPIPTYIRLDPIIFAVTSLQRRMIRFGYERIDVNVFQARLVSPALAQDMASRHSICVTKTTSPGG